MTKKSYRNKRIPLKTVKGFSNKKIIVKFMFSKEAKKWKIKPNFVVFLKNLNFPGGWVAYNPSLLAYFPKLHVSFYFQFITS